MRRRPTPSQAQLLLDQLRDERGRRIVLVSHCLLNENTRYAGGATRPGAVPEAVEELIGAGYGIHQLPCPERPAWGGILKPHTLPLYHSKGGLLYPLRGLLLWAFVVWTRLVYRRLARRVVRDVADYQRSGITVAGHGRDRRLAVVWGDHDVGHAGLVEGGRGLPGRRTDPRRHERAGRSGVPPQGRGLVHRCAGSTVAPAGI